MSLHTLANHMAQTGRGPDSMLVHMSPREVNGLQALAKAHGGSLTINPETGLPEAGFLDSLLPMILGIALAPATGGASLGITEAWQTAALVGGISTLATGSLEKGLMAGFGAYGGAGIGGSLANAGVSQIAAEELVKQGTLTPADVGQNLAGSTAPNTSTFVSGADGMPATAMAGTPVGPPSTAMSFDSFGSPTLNPATGAYEVSSMTPGAAQAPGTVPSPGAASSAMSGMPGPAGEFESLVGNGANQMSPEAYANMAAKSMTPEQLAAAKAQMITGIKNGTVSPFDSLGKGIQSLQDPGNLSKFAKSNMVPLGIAASQALLSQPKPTLRTPQSATGGFHTGYYDPVTHQYVNTGGYIPYADWGDKNVRDYTHAKDGGLMGLANGGAVAFADGGVNMTSPFMNALAHPETIPLQYGETQDQGLARIQAQQDELNLRVQNRMAMSGEQPQTVNWTQSPAGLNPSSPSVQTQADLDYWTKRTADAQGSPFVVGGGNSGGGGQDQVAYIKSLMANNPAPVGPTNAQMMYDQQTEQARTKANREAMGMPSTGGNFQISNGYIGRDPLPNESGVVVTDANGTPRYLTKDEEAKQKAYADSLYDKYKPVAPTTGTPNVPTAGGTPTDRAKAQGIQTLAKPDTAAATPSGVQQLMKDGYLVDPKTGHLVNPTLDAATLKMTRDGVNTNAEMSQAYNSYWNSAKPGDVLDFAGGTLTMNTDGTATHKYTDANGKPQSYTFNKGTDFATVAKGDANIAAEWKSMFNYVPASGTGGPGVATQVPTGFTPPVAPPTRVPTSIADFNKRFNTMTPGGDSAAMYDYLMGKPGATEPKGTTNTEVAAPYWEKMGMSPVDKTRSSRIYDPTLKNAAGKVVGGYVANPDFKQKVLDPKTKRMVDEVIATDNEKTKPTITPDEGKEWTWSKDKKQWLQTDIAADATNPNEIVGRAGGLMGYAAGGLGSLGGYSDGGRLLKGPGDGVSDSIPASIGGRQPARLADGEFVVPARIVSELGNGSTEAGARRLYQMMDRVQNARKQSIGKDKVATNSRADKYLPA